MSLPTVHGKQKWRKLNRTLVFIQSPKDLISLQSEKLELFPFVRPCKHEQTVAVEHAPPAIQANKVKINLRNRNTDLEIIT